ncbi:CobW family GTP-binding protein [Actinomadura alba]|uniref:GTP-binding protein n=1 Tax=Actinomadura alba TaxID=406431 RepID=A0ABR7LZ67_9ACTN|nr:GTP-binding protein [Actinomadura alba]MBC6470147.1 GTP-binding protein [Actinomadura alba]
MSVPVVVVSGFHGPARTAVVDRLLREHPRSLAIHHDLRGVTTGLVVRIVRDAAMVVEHAVVRLDHGCATCTIREDLIRQLRRHAAHARTLIVDLWDCVEPRSVAEALDRTDLGEELRLTAVLVALDAELTPTDVCRGERLADIGRSGAVGDDRRLAEVLTRQIEYATALVLPEVLPPPLPSVTDDDLDLCREVLDHLAPMTPVTMPGESPPAFSHATLCTRELAARVDQPTAQLPCDRHTPAADTVVWRRTRPLHPLRFFDAMDRLAAESIRSRGRFWLANRPDRLLALEAVAGVVTVQDTGPWLAALPEAAWEMVPPARRVAAALDWSAGHGDRVQHLVFTGPGLDRDRLHAELDSCLLDPDEPAVGLDDPFADLLNVREAG